ncbi:MAG: DUF938 domain-containing protein [Aliivibrio sp.]|uniref:DUF938 domain-containing protein n=1 Tax=Aliivibrio sp. TaxID=1872443 RepID=UPI001A39328C|nr:DUF938 domain-containing protein [Aliivibrio sp.]
MAKLSSPSCDRNKQPILEHLSIYFRDRKNVLEIGSGTGQHAYFFASQLPHLNWHTSDRPDSHASINAWIAYSDSENIINPLEFTVGVDGWPSENIDAVFTANTTHIMQPHEAKTMMEMVSDNLPKGAVFCQYGPMKVNDKFTTESNQAFDQTLKQRGFGGIQDIEQLVSWAKGMRLIATIPMPANNFFLVWEK